MLIDIGAAEEEALSAQEKNRVLEREIGEDLQKIEEDLIVQDEEIEEDQEAQREENERDHLVQLKETEEQAQEEEIFDEDQEVQ